MIKHYCCQCGGDSAYVRTECLDVGELMTVANVAEIVLM
jgi:hypothetical protein